METLESRLNSFTKPKRTKGSKSTSSLNWPHPSSFVATPKNLAEAGFYYNPSKDDPDNVTCFMCSKELGGWDEEDDPFEIHLRKCPKCPWALARCSLELDLDSDGNFTGADSTRLPMSKTMEKARLGTYGGKEKWWPHDLVKKHGATSKTMAKGGFAYTPQAPGDDTASCFYCDITLSGWVEDDDPLAEHHKRESRAGELCPFFHAQISSSSKVEAPQAKRSTSTRNTRSAKAPAPPVEQLMGSEDDLAMSAAVGPVNKGKKKPTSNVAAKKRSRSISSSRPTPASCVTTVLHKKSSKKTGSQLDSDKASLRQSHLSLNIIEIPTDDDDDELLAPEPPAPTEAMVAQEDAMNVDAGIETKAVVEPLCVAEEDIITAANILSPLAHTPDIPQIPNLPDDIRFASPIPFTRALATIPMQHVSTLTPEERNMTVEQWIRHEMTLQYEQLKRDGERSIEAFKERAREVRSVIEAL